MEKFGSEIYKDRLTGEENSSGGVAVLEGEGNKKKRKENDSLGGRIFVV